MTIQKFFDKIGSRKFQCAVVGIGLFLYNPAYFSGQDVLILLCVYMGFDVVDKYVTRRSPGGGDNTGSPGAA